MTYIIDAHQDIASNALTFNRDVRLSVEESRQREVGTPIPTRSLGEVTVGWPEYQKGQVAVIFATIFVPHWNYRSGEWDTQCYQTTQQARTLMHKQFDYYHRLTDENPEMFKIILNKRDLHSVLEQYEKPESNEKKQVGLVLVMEGAEGVGDPQELEEYYELGLRQVGPVWGGNRYCGGSKESRPFDKEGRELLEVMESLGLPLDISHMTENAALTALDLFGGKVCASHANARRLLKDSGGERHLTDQVISRLQERGGTIGVVPFNRFLSAEYTAQSPKNSVTINLLIDQIDYYCQMAGDSLHVGIGSDFDGGFGASQIPFEMDTVADLQKLEPLLLGKGYSPADVENIFGLNWKRHLESFLAE